MEDLELCLESIQGDDTAVDAGALVDTIVGASVLDLWANKRCEWSNSFLHDCSFDLHENAQDCQLDCVLQNNHGHFPSNNLQW